MRKRLINVMDKIEDWENTKVGKDKVGKNWALPGFEPRPLAIQDEPKASIVPLDYKAMD